MNISMLKGKIHRAKVVQAELNYVGSITVDPVLMEAAGILEYEKVQIVDVENGSRFETYTIAGEENSGMICLNGAAARMVQVGDHIILMAYADMTPEEAKEHKQHHGDQRQEDAVSGSVVGGLLVFLSQAFGQQGVDAHRNAHAEANLHILHRESQGQGSDGAFGHLGHIDAVHHIVKRLDHHGDDHGQGHVKEQLSNGHYTHLVFLNGSRLGSRCLTCHFLFYLSLNNTISIIL